MNKILIVVAVALATAATLAYIYRSDVKDAAYDKITENMFIHADNDSFDPGPALGSTFPGVRARYQDRDISVLNEFAGGKRRGIRSEPVTGLVPLLHEANDPVTTVQD